MGLPLLEGDSRVSVVGKLESRGYVSMTLQALERFGVKVLQKENVFYIPGGRPFKSPEELVVEGDWSNAAFFLCMGALCSDGVCVTGLSLRSSQADRAVCDILERMGAVVEKTEDSVTVRGRTLHGITVDASDIPDLVPVLAVTACAAKGTTRIFNAQRLRIKESDRLQTTADLLCSLGAAVTVTEDGLLIDGQKPMHGAVTDSANDHRIAMTAAVAAQLCKEAVILHTAEAVAKSYPAFWEDLEKLKGESSC